MINLPLDESIARISKKTGLSEQEVKDKIKAKLKALSGLISEEGAAHIVANELGVKLFEAGEALKIKNIQPGNRSVDVLGKVIQKYELREFNGERGPGKVASILLGDETGVIRVTMWHKQADLISQLKEGDIIKIVGGYSRENNNRTEIHLNEMSKVAINPKGVEIDVKPMAPQTFVRKKISEVQESDANVEVLGTVVQVFDLNFFEVCASCKKRVRLREEGFVCQTHGKITPDYNYVLNIYLDDGSDNMRVVLWREQVEQLMGMNKDQMLAFREDPSKFEPIKNDLLGNIIKVSGKANKNQTFDRIELVAIKVDKNPDAEEELKRLKESPPEKPADKPVQNGSTTSSSQPAKNDKPYFSNSATSHNSKGDNSGDEEINIDEELMDLDDI